jgi:hypothetical protein
MSFNEDLLSFSAATAADWQTGLIFSFYGHFYVGRHWDEAS